MSPSEAITPLEAQEIVERIAKEYGWISQAAREQSHQDALDAIEHLQIGLGSAARTLAQNLYRSNARFLFELIQNAEDNSYSRAQAIGEVPSIKFTIRPDTIVIDCNEDGFTPENVRAICRIGESTKMRANAQYYIGEKGIGFKSVFMVASKVHIQSGPFSFFFEHEPGNNGMGMITPIWEAPAKSLPGPLTRITLTLLNSLDLNDLLSQFDDFPQELLLFMKKLGKIVIDEDVEAIDMQDDDSEQEDENEEENEDEQADDEEENENEQEVEQEDEDEQGDEDEADEEEENDQEIDLSVRVKHVTAYSCEIDQNTGKARVTTSIHQANEEISSDADTYRVTRKTLSNLPSDIQRDYNTAEVILAFPVSQNRLGFDYAKISPQNVYAFLPIRDFGFPFIIHSDFVTQASREDVMENSRNRAIFEGIAGAFVDAVLQFCNHPTLQYEWVNYIPEKRDVPSPFWSELLTLIKEAIKRTPILWPQSRSRLRLIRELKIVPAEFRDRHGEPLVPDLKENEIYLDSSYKLPRLKELGLEFIHVFDRIERIGRDALSSSLKMQLADDDWHERIARILLSVFTKMFAKTKIPYVKTLPLIPLGNGSWTSMRTGPVFFPGSVDAPIPSDLGLRLIEPKSLENATRRTLFTELGAVDADENTVRTLILKKHKESWNEITLETSVSHLQYLYRTRPPLNSVKLRRSSPFRLFNDLNVAVDGGHDLYFATEEEYGASNLLAMVREKYPTQAAHAFGSFINSRYLIAIAKQKKDEGAISFEDWLAAELLVLRYPRLHDPKDTSQLSTLFLFITKSVPDKFLGTLRTYWSTYSSIIASDSVLKQNLSDVVVASTNIGPRKLSRTFLPLSELEAHARSFIKPQMFPFLTLNSSSIMGEWGFLKDVGVGDKFNIEFCLEVLQQLKENDKSDSYKIYEEIQRLIWISGNQYDDIERVSNTVYDLDLILVPAQYTWATERWTFTTACIWEGPTYMRTKYSLLPALLDVNNPTLRAFFVETLKVGNVTSEDFINELLSIKEEPTEGADIHDIYINLQAMASSLDSAELDIVRTSFEEKAIVYDTISKTWVSTSSCLWSKDAQIPGKVAISSQYADLKDLFVGTLRVKIPDLGMLVDELSQIETAELTVDDVKSLIWQINSFSPTRKAVEKLKALPIFPVREAGGEIGLTVLRVRNDRFSIIDRQSWADAFYDKIDVLDFNLEEVRKLQPFLSSFDLSSRYLSRVVVETSSFQGEDQEKSSKRMKQFRSRAYCMGRCAAHFNSPRIRDDTKFIYHLLLAAEVYEVDGIIGNLVHKDGNKIVTVEIEKSKLHLAEQSGVLKVYIPRDKKDQELCYLQILPTKIFNEIIMGYKASNSALASDSEAVRVIAALFGSSDEVVNDFLDHAGIIPLSYADEFDGEAFDREFPVVNPIIQHNNQTKLEQVNQSATFLRLWDRQSSRGTIASSRSPPVSISSSFSDARSSEATLPRSYQSSPTAVSSPPPTIQSDPLLPYLSDSTQSEYHRLLSNVITIAKSKRGGFPSLGAFNFHDLLSALPIGTETAPVSFDMPFGTRTENQIAHDMKVGAAGELYVFEILKRLKPGLPGFGQGNWKSTIRKYVTVHADYTDMEPWNGPETADITYDDTQGEFTKLLIENKYLDNIWIGAKPKYFLEVKTTTKECNTRFFISKSQYRRMEEMRLKEGETSSEVYIIFRVFNLNKMTIDMRLYVDPKSVDEGGNLVFVPESYSVLPAGSAVT